MAAPRFLALLSGRIKQIITIAASTGVGDADKVPATNASGVLDPSLLNAVAVSAGASDSTKVPLLDGAGRLDSTFMPVGVGADTASVISSENLSAGDVVNIWNNAGAPNVRKADATTEGKEAIGFVLAGVIAPAAATVFFEGQLTGLTALVPGSRYYVGTTAGVITATPPAMAGNVSQFVGIATSTTTVSFEAADGITVA